jgi:hypothetical protein
VRTNCVSETKVFYSRPWWDKPDLASRGTPVYALTAFTEKENQNGRS